MDVLLESVSWTSVALASFVLLTVLLYQYLEGRDLPPGPVGLPLLGYLPFLKYATCHKQLGRLREKYGDVTSFYITGRLYINLASVKAVREAHVTKADCFQARPSDFSLMSFVFSDGMVFANGDKWRQLRRFFLQSFRDRGMLTIKKSLGGPMSDAMQTMVKELTALKGEPMSMLDLLYNKCNGVFKDSLFGSGGISLREIEDINKLYKVVTDNFTGFNMLPSGFISKYLILPCIIDMKTVKRNRDAVVKIIERLIQEQKSKMEDNDGSDDIISMYYKERDERKRKDDQTYKYFTDEALVGTLIQFVGDGANSVASFVAIFAKALLDHPEQQDRIRDEVDEVVGPGRQPGVEDKNRTPYTNAFMQEVLRTTDFFPFFPSLLCTKETTLGGYRVPVGSTTLVNMWSVHNNPDLYQEPDKFDPERFLSGEGKTRAELPITFGVGKRNCIGEGFVILQTYLFVTTLMKNFRLERFDTNVTKTTFELLRSKELLVIAHPRN